MKTDEDAVIDQALNTLIEHFDTVQIFLTKHEGGETDSLVVGRGNWFARHSQIIQWLKREDERLRQRVRES